MAHVHGDKKKAAEVAAHAARSAMSGPASHGPMMGGMMEHMMGPGPHGPMAGNPGHGAKAVAKGAAATAGGSLMGRLARHPLLVFGLGVAAGIVVYKYRKQIISTAVRAGEKSKDFVLQQKETLEDIVAETKEEGEK